MLRNVARRAVVAAMRRQSAHGSKCGVSSCFSSLLAASSAASYSTSPVCQMGIMSAVAGVVARALGAVSRALAAGASEDARLGRYLHYNMQYRAARSPSLRFQCSHGFILGAPIQISTPLADAQSVKPKSEGGLSASESAAVLNAVKGIPLEAAFPVLRGGSARGTPGPRSSSGNDDGDEVCGMLYIRAIARQAESRGADAAAAAAKASASLLPKGKPHSAAAKLSAGTGAIKSSSGIGANAPAPTGQMVPAKGSGSDVAAASSTVDLTGGLPVLQPLKGSVAGIPLTLAVRSRRVLQAVAGQQAAFVEASEAAAAAAREARMEARIAARDAMAARAKDGARGPAATNDGAAATAEPRDVASGHSASSSSSALVNGIASNASNGDAAALAASVAEDFAPILGSAGMFTAEQLQDTADEARCRGLAPAVTFDVHEAVFVPSTATPTNAGPAAGSARGGASSSARFSSPSSSSANAAAGVGPSPARLDLTRELRGIVFDDLGALADGAASVILQRPDGVAGLPDAALLAAAAAPDGARAALAGAASAAAAAAPYIGSAPASAPGSGAASHSSSSLPATDVSSLPAFKP